MKTLVVMSGGFHPFHAGHMALYNAAKKTFPDADVVVGATNVQKDRPFPFKIKQKLAQVSGVPPKNFVEVSRQFSAQDPEIAKRIRDPEDTVLIFVRSEKDKNEAPMPWSLNPDGSVPVAKRTGKPLSNYLLPYKGNENNLEPLTKHAYMAYLPTVEFGPGITSATEIRNAWPTLDDRRKTAMVMSLYPATQKNPKLAANVVAMLDQVMGSGEQVQEDVAMEPLTNTVVDFYKPVIGKVHKEKVDDYVDRARALMQKTDDPSIRKKLLDIFKKGKDNPYIQGGIITTVGSLLAGGLLSASSKMGLSPSQTNILLQAVLNTVIPTLVSRVNGKNWKDTIKYTLASAGIGTGIATITEDINQDYLEEK